MEGKGVGSHISRAGGCIDTGSRTGMLHQTEGIIKKDKGRLRLTAFKPVGPKGNVPGCQLMSAEIEMGLTDLIVGKLKTESVVQGGSKGLDDEGGKNLHHLVGCIGDDFKGVVAYQVIEIVIPLPRPEIFKRQGSISGCRIKIVESAQRICRIIVESIMREILQG